MVLYFAQVSGAVSPIRFEDYKTDGVFQGDPVGPKISDPIYLKYRTRIRDGVEKGWGVFRDGAERKGPNFAGHLIAIRWGCGTGCAVMVIVDARNGQVHDPPLSMGRLGEERIALPMFEGGIALVEYRLTSRLFKMKACPGDPRNLSLGDPCYEYDYLWDDDHWTLLRRQPLKP
ncbi:MAG: hypothetical protein ABSC23_05080 [Bryobacteraceae bacterium]